MKRREIAVLACKLFSLYVAYRALIVLAGVAMTLASPKEQDAWLMDIASGIPLLLLILMGLILWFKSDWVATHLVLATKAHETDSAPDSGNLHPIAFSVLGVFVLTNVIPQVVGRGVSIHYEYPSPQYTLGEVLALPAVMAEFASLGTFLIMGVALILGARGFVGFLRIVRTAGLPQRTDVGE